MTSTSWLDGHKKAREMPLSRSLVSPCSLSLCCSFLKTSRKPLQTLFWLIYVDNLMKMKILWIGQVWGTGFEYGLQRVVDRCIQSSRNQPLCACCECVLLPNVATVSSTRVASDKWSLGSNLDVEVQQNNYRHHSNEMVIQAPCRTVSWVLLRGLMVRIRKMRTVLSSNSVLSLSSTVTAIRGLGYHFL